VCVVTGASQGLGKEILTAFALSGAHGAVVDLSQESAEKSVSEILEACKQHGELNERPDLRAYVCDASKESEVEQTFSDIVKDFKRVDVLVTNAGITGGMPAEEYAFDKWKQMIDVNVHGTFLFARAAGRYFIKERIQGVVLMVSSMSGVIVNRPQKQSAYNASKAAVAQMTKSFAAEWAPHGIRVNALAPGYIQTAANEDEEMEKLSKQWIKDIPMGRIAEPHEFGGTAVWMCSPASSYLTGSEIVVDGGYTIL